MLFCKTLHKGNFIKEIFTGNFISNSYDLMTDIDHNNNHNNSPDTQILVVTEKSIEIFDYFYDSNTSIPFLEPKFNQELFFHIYDVKILKCKKLNTTLIILLTACGIVILTFSPEKNLFTPCCSEILNLNCEEKDKLMYLKVNENLNLMVAYSNTDKMLVYKLTEDSSKIDLKLINSQNVNTLGYIVDIYLIDHFADKVFILSKRQNNFLCDIFTSNLSEDPQIVESNNFSKNLFNCANFLDNSFQLYQIIMTTYNNFVICLGENGIKILRFKDNELVYEKKFKKSNTLCSYCTFSNYIQIILENKILIFQEDVINKSIKEIKIVKNSMFNDQTPIKEILKNKNIVQIFEKDFYFIYYDHKMNFIYTHFTFEPDMINNSLQVKIKIINEFKDNSFYCLDSALMKTNNENVVYALTGLKGNSRLIKLEKGLNESIISSFDFHPVEDVFPFESYDGINHLLFLTAVGKTQILKLNTRKELILSEYINDVNFSQIDEKTINIFKVPIQSENKLSIVTDYSIRLYHFDEKLDNILNKFSYEFKNQNRKIILANSFIFSNILYYSLYFNNNMFSIYYFDNNTSSFIEDCSFKFQENPNENGNSFISNNVSCFDFYYLENSVVYIFSTYASKIEYYLYDFCKRTLEFKNFFYLNNDNIPLVSESIKIVENKYLFTTTRTGEFCIFYIDNFNLNSLGFIALPHNEKESLKISNFSFSKNKESLNVNLYNSSNVYLYEFYLNTNRINKLKYLIKNQNSFNTFNSINFFKNIPLGFSYGKNFEISFYQNYDKMFISFFSKQLDNTLVPDEVIEFKKNQFARKMLSYDDDNLIIVLETKNASIRNIWKSISLVVYNCKTRTEKHFELDHDNMKINNIKLLEFAYKEDQLGLEEKMKKYISLALQKDDNKGLLVLYEVVTEEETIVDIKKSYPFASPGPVLDICSLNDYIILTTENKIGIIKVEYNLVDKKFVMESKNGQRFNNMLLSVFPINKSDMIVIGDSQESFVLMNFDTKKIRFEVCAADLALRSLYQGKILLLNPNLAIPEGDSKDSVILLQKTGIFSKFKLKEEIYEVTHCYDTKEFINKCHIIKP